MTYPWKSYDLTFVLFVEIVTKAHPTHPISVGGEDTDSVGGEIAESHCRKSVWDGRYSCGHVWKTQAARGSWVTPCGAPRVLLPSRCTHCMRFLFRGSAFSLWQIIIISIISFWRYLNVFKKYIYIFISESLDSILMSVVLSLV